MSEDLRELVGEWRFDRRLLDRAAGLAGCAHGTLTIAAGGEGRPGDGALRWDEAGQMTWAGRTFPVTRSLRAAIRDGEWWLDFDHGRPFHPWRPGEWVTHPCAEDTYRGLAEPRGDGRWRITWDVTGPTKDQLLLTRLRRLPTPPPRFFR